MLYLFTQPDCVVIHTRYAFNFILIDIFVWNNKQKLKHRIYSHT